MGLYQNCYGQFDIDVVGKDVVSIDRRFLHPLQRRYQMKSGYDEDFVCHVSNITVDDDRQCPPCFPSESFSIQTHT